MERRNKVLEKTKEVIKVLADLNYIEIEAVLKLSEELFRLPEETKSKENKPS